MRYLGRITETDQKQKGVGEKPTDCLRKMRKDEPR